MSLRAYSQLKRGVQFSCIAATTHHIPDVNPVDDLDMLMKHMKIQREPDLEALHAQSVITGEEIYALSKEVELLKKNQISDRQELQDIDAHLKGIEITTRSLRV